jgi:choline transport protein
VGVASISAILGNQTVSMYAAFHADFVVEKWHVLVGYLICTWVSCATVLFANKLLPVLETLGGYFILAGVVITIIVCATMPHVNGTPYTPSEVVWRGWDNRTGYSNDFFVFLAGMVNGAYAIGTPDCVSHLAEEIPRPSVNLPKAIGIQFVLGFFTAFFYLIAILYATTDLAAVGLNGTFPLAAIYRQATGSRGGALGLLIVAFIPTLLNAIGLYIICGRMFWTLARDNATPFSPVFARISPRFRNPFNATLLCGVICTLMGCMYVGSSTAFNAFVGSFVQLTTLSYLMAILPHLLSGRSNIVPGWFWMRGFTGYIVNLISCIYMAVFIVIFCFPYALPTTAATMNYASLITGGLSLFVAAWWFLHQAKYVGPQYVPVMAQNMAKDAM